MSKIQPTAYKVKLFSPHFRGEMRRWRVRQEGKEIAAPSLTGQIERPPDQEAVRWNAKRVKGLKITWGSVWSD
ncbi:MAG: hypothetical protein V1800_09340 [Candidatus Latescibacterota bacterium]